MLKVVVELQVDRSHLHDNHLLQVFVFQDRAQHRVRLGELEPDGATLVGLVLLRLGRFSVDAVSSHIHVPRSRCSCVMGISHSSMDDFLDIDLHSVHLRLLLAGAAIFNSGIFHFGETHANCAICGEVHGPHVESCSPQHHRTLVEGNGLVQESVVQQADRERIEGAIPREGNSLNLERRGGSEHDGSAHNDEQIENFGANDHTDASIRSCIEGDQVREELWAIAAQGTDGGPGDCLLSPSLHPLVLALPHLLNKDIDRRNKVCIAHMVLSEEHKANHHEPEASNHHTRLHCEKRREKETERNLNLGRGKEV
mmetsp:Transcript_78268/g.162564  ORF Transcript_78268/g.162564 Transcript_78268/m.162564 type:complete len:312 (+) Transcript_78268:1268-2203(+)